MNDNDYDYQMPTNFLDNAAYAVNLAILAVVAGVLLWIVGTVGPYVVQALAGGV